MKYGGRAEYNFGGQVTCDQAFIRKEVIFAGRRWGKSAYASRRLLSIALQGGFTWWIWPTKPDAREGWDFLKALCNKIPGRKVSEVDRRIIFANNGYIQIKGAHEPDSLRGRGLHHVIMDEASYMRHGEYIYSSVISKSLATYQGGVTIITSPNGFDWVYDLFTNAKDHPIWTAFRFPSWDNPTLPISEIEEMKNDPLATEEDFRREVAAESFASAEAVFGNFYKVAIAKSQDYIEDHYYTAAIDLARLHDFSCISITDSSEILKIPHQVHIERVKTISWHQIAAKFVNTLKSYNIDTAIVDTTGVGDPVYEIFEEEISAIDEDIALDPFLFSPKSKEILIKAYAISLEREKYHILKEPWLMQEHNKFEAKLNPNTRRVSYAASKGHDDGVITTALNWKAHNERWIE